MRIHIRFGYRGERTNEQFMPPGEYDVEDSFAAYLIGNGHALAVVEEAPRAPEPETPEEPLPDFDYDALSVSELRELAEAAGISVPKRSTKPELIALLVQADAKG